MNLCNVFIIVSVFSCVLFVNCALGFSSCKTPTLKYGRIRSRQRGRAIKFLCSPGYQLAGERTTFCINGTWDSPLPKCVRGSCAKRDSPPQNGLILPTYNGGVLNFYCQQGFELNGPAAIFCDGSNWDNHRPSCVRANTKVKLFCDFEDSDLCHWTHDLNHDMDWMRDSYKTPTGYSMPTGPSFDHTKGNGSNGHYMYLESSSRRMNDTARLISPMYDKMDENICLEFWYHMYGRTTGTLRAYLRRINDPWPVIPKNAIFSKSGDQGNVWYREFINLGSINTSFQIIMEGVRGNGYVSDIAIDDIKIIPNCIPDEHLQSTTEFNLFVSDILKTIETCENRCGQKASGNESSQIISCDCDDFCYEASKCCPDYIDTCLSRLFTTENTTSADDYTSTTENLAIARSSRISTYNPPNRLPNPTSTSTRRPSVHTMPTLIILQPPTTPEVLQKKNSAAKNVSKIVFVKPKKSTTSKVFNDDVVVPTMHDNDDELLLTSPLPFEEDNNDINDDTMQEKEDYVEKMANEKDYPFKIVHSSSDPVGEIKTEFSEVQEDHSNINLALITIATVCGIVLAGFLATVAWGKLRTWRYRSRRITSGQGDSQSDVRFLTADEILDFSLDKDYEDL
ncbi:uncharacterized protein [Euwallacea similis]|uniref:uncharacterized protein n=1 Tax=Euwallacea similis TaxID=1736056 RepID=UPI0034504A37